MNISQITSGMSMCPCLLQNSTKVKLQKKKGEYDLEMYYIEMTG